MIDTQGKATLTILLAAVGLSAMTAGSSPARAGAFDSIKRAAMKHLKKEAQRQLESAAPSVSEMVTTKVMDTAGLSDNQGEASEPEVETPDSADPSASDDDAAAEDEVEERALITLLLPAMQKVREPTASHSLSLNFTKITYSTAGTAVGDVNGDGTADIIVGPGTCTSEGSAATVETLLSGMDKTRKTHWSGVLQGHDLAASCAMARDVRDSDEVEAAANLIVAQDSSEAPVMLLPAVQRIRAAANGPQAAVYIRVDGIDGND